MTPEISLAAPSALQPLMIKPVVIQPVSVPCAAPSEPFNMEDYSGPMNRLVAHVSRKAANNSARVPHRQSALRPCAMDAGDKFRAFLGNASSPLTYVGAAWNAALAQLTWDDAGYGLGAAGYGKRYCAAVTDSVAGDFFKTFLFPTVFRQDPRYFRLGQGTAGQRIKHALAHTFVTRSDSGKRMFNYSEWVGTASSKALSNLYHPGNPRGFAPTASRVGFSLANDMAWDLLREFWPEVAHKFRLPFRTRKDVVAINGTFTPGACDTHHRVCG